MSNLSWDAIGAVAEAIAALLVVGSLLFVGFQIRQSVREARAAAMNNIMNVWVEFYLRISEDAELSDILRKGAKDLTSLTDQQRYRLTMVLTGMFRAWHNAWYQWRLGVYDSESWESQMIVIKSILTLPGPRAVWDDRKFMLPEAFQSYVEAKVAATGAVDSYEWLGSDPDHSPNE